MESRQVIYIRTDGNETIATGHLMRCLSIARALVKRNALPVFLLSDTTSIFLLEKMISAEEKTGHAFPVIHMQTDYRDLDREIPTLQRILASRAVSCFLVDSYFVTERYLSEVGRLCRTAYLDDLQAFDYPVNLVINYDVTVDTGFYTHAQRVLSGLSYTPLREQFSLFPYRFWEEVRDVLISTGGTDPFFIAGGLARQLLCDPKFQNSCLHILTGPMHIHRAELDELADTDSRVVLHENVSDMAELMASCDLAVCAAGTTLYELCAIGVPSVSYTMADNQIPGAKAFAQAGLIPYIGDIRNHPHFFETACDQLCAMASDPSLRRQQSIRMRMAVDAAGADRIAAELLAPLPA